MSFKIERDTYQQQGAAGYLPAPSQFTPAPSQFTPAASQFQPAASQFGQLTSQLQQVPSQFQPAVSQFSQTTSQFTQAAPQLEPPQPSTTQKLLHPIRTAERALAGPPIPGTSGHHPFAEVVGTALTGGRQNAGTKGYLAVCITAPPPQKKTKKRNITLTIDIQ